jgi:tRNA G18 (ribose-2'-O)-methylase SpoU
METKEEKDARLESWIYNVQDRFKSYTQEEIKQELANTSNPFAVCFENILGDFNLGTGIRNANAFNAREIFYLGKKKWDRRGAQGVHNYSPVKRLETVEDLVSLQDRYVLIGVDNVPGSISIKDIEWPDNPLMIFGEEGAGLSNESKEAVKLTVEIPMFGSVRSINVGTASGILMYDYLVKKGKI